MLEHGNRTKIIFFSIILLAMALGVGIGTIITRQASADHVLVAERLKIQGEGSPLTLGKKVDLAEGFSGVAEAVRPAVVNISTTTKMNVRKMHQDMGPFGDEFWRRFFGEGMPRDYVQRSLGSGILVDSKGFIVTNNHVVDGADSIMVKLADGREFPATVVGTDPAGEEGGSDLAVIRIQDDKPLPFARLGDVDALKIGDWVVAIGSPFGLEQSVTAGILSAKGRIFLTQSVFSTFLQTDAAINPGNSGGPLVNMRGEVVGINTFIETQTGGNLGVGFAVPADVVANVYNQIIEFGKVSRGHLGIYMNTYPITAAMQKYFGLKDKSGVIVTDLAEKNSPARDAGIQPEDVITAVNGKEVADADALRGLVANTAPGSTVHVKVVRKGKEMTFDVKLGERPAFAARSSSGPMDLDEVEKKTKPEIGLTVEDIPARVADQLDLKTGEGVLVSEVKAGSLAEDAHLMVNDIIVAVDGDKVGSAQDFVNKIRGLRSGDSVVIKFFRMAERNKLTYFTSLTKP